MDKFKNENYHFSPVYISIIFVETLLLTGLALVSTVLFPIMDMPYIGTKYQSFFSAYFDKTLAEGTTFLLLINLFIYWCISLIPICLSTDLFLKYLIGYEMSFLKSIKLTFNKVLITTFKYGALGLLLVFSVIIGQPIINILDTEMATSFNAVLHLVIGIGIFTVIKVLVLYIYEKITLKKEVLTNYE